LTEDQKSYRQIFKATSLFGGVQAFNIIISIIRSKIVAVLLGPAGMGIAELFTSTTGLVGEITNIGLGTSAIRDVAAANEGGDTYKVSRVVIVFRRLVWITGTLGAVVTLILSPLLSQLSFGNKNYTIAFIWLSITLLFNQLTSGQNVLLQGMRKLKYLAKANMWGSALGLAVSVPIYYFWRIDGIVPAIIVSSALALSIAWYFASKVKIDKVKVDKQDIIYEGKGMLKMGFIISLSGMIGMGTSYILRIFISNIGGVEAVGLYSAGFAIISSYVGLVFKAMSTDYYPRLAGVAHDNSQASMLINQQAEVAILILAPILTIFLIFINWVIVLLYSEKFTPINAMIHWAALGIYFKAVSWSMAFIQLAKGASNLFFWNGLISNLYILGLNIIGYKLFGLEGLGISFMVGYLIFFIQIFIVIKHKFDFSFSSDFIKTFGIQFILGLLCFTVIKFLHSPLTYLFGILLMGFSSWFSLRELNKRMHLRELLVAKITEYKLKQKRS